MICQPSKGIIDSRTIFDCAGYPVTVFENSLGFIGINFYLSGTPVITTLLAKGTSPNVVVAPSGMGTDDMLVAMWIPVGYTNSLSYVTSSDCFRQVFQYPINVPGSLQSFTVRQTTDTNWTFSFTTSVNGINQVYFANT